MDENIKQINLQKPKERKRFLKKIKPLLILMAILFIATFIWSFFSSTSSVFKYGFGNVLNPNPLKQTDGRVNVLLLGTAGGKHDGPDLTDSIIVASYHLKSGKVTLISIPRDLWLESIKQKVNAAYVLGKEKDENKTNAGLKFAEDKIDDIVGIPIHYGVRLDFDGFAQAIDQVGGINVEVPKAFDDYNYPIAGRENDLCGYREEERDFSEQEAKQLNIPVGKRKVFIDPEGKVATDSADLNFYCRFERIRFEQGVVYMNGETALKFVRSRMGTNNEGTDFARSRRQQIVIQAFREKALSIQTLANPGKVTGLISTFGDSIETDIPMDKVLEFYNLAKNVSGTTSIVLGDLGDGNSILINPPYSDYGGAYVLIPPNNDFTKIKEFIKRKLDEQAAGEEAK